MNWRYYAIRTNEVVVADISVVAIVVVVVVVAVVVVAVCKISELPPPQEEVNKECQYPVSGRMVSPSSNVNLSHICYLLLFMSG